MQVLVHNRRYTKWPKKGINDYVETLAPVCKRIVFGKNRTVWSGNHKGNGNTFKFEDDPEVEIL
jgi:hypothetical protein